MITAKVSNWLLVMSNFYSVSSLQDRSLLCSNCLILKVLDQQNCILKCQYKLLRWLKRKLDFKKCFCFYCAGAHLDSTSTLLSSDFMELLFSWLQTASVSKSTIELGLWRHFLTHSPGYVWESPQHKGRSARQLPTIKAVMPVPIKGSSASLKPLVFLKNSLIVPLDVPCLNGLSIKGASRWLWIFIILFLKTFKKILALAYP